MLLQLTDALVFGLLRLDPASRWAGALHFFLYDAVKILLLLAAFVFFVGVLRTFLPQEKIRAWMGRGGGIGNLFAALFGALTPFCSCSSIPLFIGFLKAGVPLGIGFSFLVASPLINEYLVVLMAGFFGWKIAALYAASGVLVGVAAGIVLGRLGLERHLVADLAGGSAGPALPAFPSWAARLGFGRDEAVSILRKIWLWVLGGVALGAVIHNFVPQEAVRSVIGRTGVFSVPIATLLGVPMYGSCAAIVPIAVVLFQKGVPLGTALAFTMAVSALSLPEAVMLRRAMRLPLIGIFFGVTTMGIVLTGYLFNFLQPLLG